MNLIHRIFFALCMLAIMSFRLPVNEEAHLSTLIFRLQYSSPGSKGFGGSIRIKNIETGMEYTGRSHAGLSPFVVVKDIPPGRYQVATMEVITGTVPLRMNSSDMLGQITIDTPMAYYLGSYNIKKTGSIGSRDLKIVHQDNDKIQKIRKQLKKNGDNQAERPIQFRQQLFVADITETKHVAQ